MTELKDQQTQFQNYLRNADEETAPSWAKGFIWPTKQALNIYRHGYRKRLFQCLEEDYPVLKATLGSQLFDHLALDYLQHHPSQSSSLSAFGKDLPEFLATTQPQTMKDSSVAQLLAMAVDIAKMERLYLEIRTGPGNEANPSDPAGASNHFAAAPCLKILALNGPLLSYFQAVKAGEEARLPQPSPHYLAMGRHAYRVTMGYVNPVQYHLLTQLLSGETWQEALFHTAKAFDQPATRLRHSLYYWLPHAQELGWLI